MERLRKIGVIVAVLVSSGIIMNYFFIVLPERRNKDLLSKQFESVSPKKEFISEENVLDEMQNEENAESSSLIDFESFNKKIDEKKDYAANPNNKTADYQSSDLNKTSKQTDKESQQEIIKAKQEADEAETKIQQEIANTKMEADKKVQGSLAAKLEADKALYDAKMKKLYLDCEHQFDSIQSQENDEILDAKSMHIFNGGDPADEDLAHSIDRIKDRYKAEYTYLANTCEVNMELIETTKYW